MAWGTVVVALGIGAVWARWNPSGVVRIAVAGTATALGLALVGHLVWIAGLPEAPTPLRGTWGSSRVLAQTPTHVFVYGSSELFVADLEDPTQVVVLEDGIDGTVRSVASDGKRVLITYFADDPEGGEPERRGGWALASPEEWITKPHRVRGHGTHIGTWWSPDGRTFTVASLSRHLDAPTEWRLRVQRVAPGGAVTEDEDFELESPPASWSRSNSLMACSVEGELRVAAPPGPACRLTLGEGTASCVPLPQTEGARCNNQMDTYYEPGATRLTETGTRAFPWATAPGARPNILDLWYAFDAQGRPTQVTKHWTGSRQEFRADQTLWITESATLLSAETWPAFPPQDHTLLTVARMDGTPVAEARVLGARYLTLLPSPEAISLLGLDEAVRLDARTLTRLDATPLTETLRAYLSAWGGQSTLFEVWVLCAVALTPVPLLLVAPPALRRRRGTWRMLLAVAAVQSAALSSVIQRLWHL